MQEHCSLSVRPALEPQVQAQPALAEPEPVGPVLVVLVNSQLILVSCPRPCHIPELLDYFP